MVPKIGSPARAECRSLARHRTGARAGINSRGIDIHDRCLVDTSAVCLTCTTAALVVECAFPARARLADRRHGSTVARDDTFHARATRRVTHVLCTEHRALRRRRARTARAGVEIADRSRRHAAGLRAVGHYAEMALAGETFAARTSLVTDADRSAVFRRNATHRFVWACASEQHQQQGSEPRTNENRRLNCHGALIGRTSFRLRTFESFTKREAIFGD